MKLLEDSHFMPSSLYDYCRGTNGLDPIKFSSEYAMSTSRQTHDYLLCGSCEDVLNEGGESWVVSKLATWEKTFPLYDLVTSGPLLLGEEGWAVYSGARNPALDVQKIAHFFMGIFWKASVYSWRGDSDEPRIQLGPYSEDIRKYLLRGAFPENIALAVVLSPPENAYIGFNEPYEAVRDAPYRNFMLCVPGIWCMLSVGKMIPQENRLLSIGSGPEHPIMVSVAIAAKGLETAFNLFKEARKTKSFSNAMDKVRVQRQTGAA